MIIEVVEEIYQCHKLRCFVRYSSNGPVLRQNFQFDKQDILVSMMSLVTIL